MHTFWLIVGVYIIGWYVTFISQAGSGVFDGGACVFWPIYAIKWIWRQFIKALRS